MLETIERQSTSNKRIARNTLFLYIRLGVIMLVKLYTSRVLLNVLGIDDYGVYNAVAAFVISFSFISSPLITATQRFLNFDMGKGGFRLNTLFVTSFLLFIIVSLILTLGLETVGTWFLNNKMNFPQDRVSAVNILFQLTVLSLVINILRMPYESTVIAEEKMSFYAIICMIEAFLTLGTAFMLKVEFYINKLVLYGTFNVVYTILLMLVYKVYCNHKFPYTKIKNIRFNKATAKEVCIFSGWNFFGSLAAMTATQGITTLINIFFGVVCNAAYGIAIQIQSAVGNIVQNFQKAANPQITKSYSEGSLDHTRFLVVNVSKFSFILTLLFVVPLICNIDFVLKLWLGNNVPPSSQLFSCLVLCLVSLVSFAGPMEAGIMATGKIKSFQITFSILIFLNIITTYLVFKHGASAYWAIIIKCIVELIVIVVRIVYLRKGIALSAKYFTTNTFIPCAIIASISIFFIIAIVHIFPESGWRRLIFSATIYLLLLFLNTYFIALSKSQRRKLKQLNLRCVLS